MHGAYCTDIRHRHRGGMSNKTPPPTELQIPATVTTLNLTQQKHVFTNQNECTTTQNKPKNLKPGLVAFYDIQLGNREGLFWFWCFIHLSLTYLDTHPFTAPGPTWGCTLTRHVLRSNPAVPHVHVTTQSLTAVLPL